MIRKTLFSICLIAVLTLAAVSHAASVSPAADSFVDSSSTVSNGVALNNFNFGGAGALAISANLSKGTFNSYMRFDTSSAVSSFNTQFGVGNWTITSAELDVNASTPNNSIFNGSGASASNIAGLLAMTWIADDSWTEGNGMPNSNPVVTTDITWNTQPAVAGSDESMGTYSFNGANSGLKQIPLTLGASALADITAGNLLSMRLSAGDSTIAFVFNSQNFSQGVNAAQMRPFLIINAVPEPACLSGIVLALALVRRRAR